jgi:hypothetical protein
MISQVIGKGTVDLTAKDFDEIPSIVPHELPNTDMYETVCQFKIIGMQGDWILIDIVLVDGEDEAEKGVNVFAHRINIVEKY